MLVIAGFMVRKKAKIKGLAPKHKKFADEWMSCMSIVSAYEKVYGARRDRHVSCNNGSVIYNRPDVQAYIKTRLEEVDQLMEGKRRELFDFWMKVRYGVIQSTDEEPLHHKIAVSEREARALGMFVDKSESTLKGQMEVIIRPPKGFEKC